jgi:hypothetical protein
VIGSEAEILLEASTANATLVDPLGAAGSVEEKLRLDIGFL